MGARGGRADAVTVLVRAAFLVNAAYAESGRRFGFTPQQGQLLSVLRSRSFLMGELTAALGLAKSTTTGLVEVLERRGCVQRRTGPSARSVQVALTPDGRRAADEFYTATRSRIEGMLAVLDAGERAAVAALLGRVTEAQDLSMIFMDVDDPTGAATRVTAPG